MSVEVMSQVFKRFPLGGGIRLLALALADHASDDGTRVYPSVPLLAQKTLQSERTVQYQLRQLSNMGWLRIVRESRGGKGNTTEYRIDPAWVNGATTIAPLDPPQPVQSGPPDDRNGAIFAPLDTGQTVQSDALTVQLTTSNGAIAVAPEPSKNHQEPSKRQRTHAPQPEALRLTMPTARPRKSSRQIIVDPEDERLARWMFDLILKLHPKHEAPNFTKWADDIRLMREVNKREPSEIARLFRWANGHQFWCTNILSPHKLRQRWDQLCIQRAADGTASGAMVRMMTQAAPPVDRSCSHLDESGRRCGRVGVTSLGNHASSPWRCAEHAEIDVEAAA